MKKQTLIPNLREILAIVSDVTGQGSVYHSSGNQPPLISNDVCSFCSYCLKHPIVGPYCRYACHSASMQTLTSGEPHYQRCWAGLLYVSVAVAPHGEFLGGVSMGGFHTKDENTGMKDLVVKRLSAVPKVNTAPFLARLSSLHEIEPGALRGMGLFLLETTFSTGVNSSKWFRKQHGEYLQQREIAEAYVDLKQVNLTPPDIMADTYQLASYLHRRDREGAMKFISSYLAKLLLISNWNLTKLRAYVRVLLVVITSQDILDGMDQEAATRREWLYMSRIEKAVKTETICSEVAELVLQHFGRMDTADIGEQTISDKITEWLERNCHERATLQDASKAIGASVSSIAHQLPQETGKTFGELRREIRIALAKRLLATSSMNISSIADACGFADQSHFTKTFKSEITLTPGKFRKMLKQWKFNA
ncbi:helix-turn-helix domain-containing protein [PVC group bacterium]|nr:helix-turn-helix domain-containing protein [PVC group bacterium]